MKIKVRHNFFSIYILSFFSFFFVASYIYIFLHLLILLIQNLLASIESTPLPVEVVDISTGKRKQGEYRERGRVSREKERQTHNVTGAEEIVGVAAVYLVEVMKTRPTGTEAGGVLFVWDNYVPIHAYVPDSDGMLIRGREA